jgi:cytochrome P450
VGLQAHGMPGYGAILTEQDEERWRAIRKAIAPAFTLSAVR